MLLGPSIPGETPIDDVSGLKIRGITTRGQLSGFEAENILKATARYLATRPISRTAPFTVTWSLKLHKQMFGDVWKWAGAPRTRDGLNVGQPFHQITPLLHDLMQDLRLWHASGMEFAEQAARLHHRAVWIHPFQNGNGRWARLLANIWLRLHRQSTTDWPEHVVGQCSAIRDEYLASVRSADGGDFGALISLHRRYAGNP